jgi:DNA repair exonuclease SbcCD nuclease subunit
MVLDVKFVHAADLHLDSPLRGLDRYEGAPRHAIRAATRRALENLVGLCIEEGARLLVIAGDLYDGRWKDYGTGLFFASQMAQLREGGVRVVLLRGNHDAESQIPKNLKLPENVRELSVKKPETILFEDLGVAVHGQGFATRAVTTDLARDYPQARPGFLNIGVLHTSVDGREGHDAYAPTTVETLAGKGYDYWALGHVHAREVLSTDPWIVFPGNLQGRHAKETGPKGATLVTAPSGRVERVEHRALDVVRWARLTVDASACTGEGHVLDRVREALEKASGEAEGRALAARVIVTGQTKAHVALETDPEHFVAEVRAAASDVAGEVWVEKVRLETRAALDLPALRAQAGPIGELVRAIDGLRASDEALRALGGDLEELRRKLPAELREGEDALRLDDPAYLRALLADVEQMIVPRLLEGEAPR